MNNKKVGTMINTTRTTLKQAQQKNHHKNHPMILNHPILE
jgi:hypothetical protein